MYVFKQAPRFVRAFAPKRVQLRYMSAVSAASVKSLRDITQAPMMNCKKALEATGGDLDAAIDWLRKQGMIAATKKAGRSTSQGLVGLHVSGTTASIVEVNSETDFVARNEHFQQLVSKSLKAALDSLSPSNIKTDVASANAAAQSAVEVLNNAKTLDAQGNPCDIASAVHETISKVGENVVIRRAGKMDIPGGYIAAYTHNALAPGIGSLGILVGLSAVNGSLPTSGPAFEAVETLGKQLSMHIAAAKPSYPTRAAVPAADVQREFEVIKELVKKGSEGKSDDIIQKMTVGKMNKWYGDNVLDEQANILNEKQKIKDLVAAASKAAGVEIKIEGFLNFVVGELAPPATEE